MTVTLKLDAMSGGLPIRRIHDLAREVQDTGFSGLWLTEGGRSAYNLCTAAALATDALDVGTAIGVAFPRSPMVSAQVAWELQEATNGRFVLGLGTQVKAHVERRYSSTFAHPGPRMREYVLAVKAAFRAFRGTEKLAFAGDYYTLSLLPDMWSPGPIAPADPPVYVAAVNPWMCTMIGEVADGVHVHPFHSVRYLDEVVRPAVAAGTAKAGRDASEIAFVCPLLTIVGDTEEERAPWRERARMQLAFYGSTRTYGRVFELHGWPGTAERLHELQARGDIPDMAATITDEMLQVYALEATWDTLADAIVERYRGQADRVICYFATASWERHPEIRGRWAEVARAVTQAE
ncbi:MAG TPA: TIGR03617 family F420-dependent LLM class oxidoreductase [Acidimicrobiia bacterium]|nr:TIGR03617 family F420-dependent LLM class oxidoreductase [Acidimicrobiia bacterium]